MQQPPQPEFCHPDISCLPAPGDAGAARGSAIPGRVIGLLAVVGPLAAIAATLLLLDLGWLDRLSAASPLLMALVDVVCPAAAAAALTWIFWPQHGESLRLKWSVAAVSSGPGWVLIPPAVLFLARGSVWAEWISALAAGTAAYCLRSTIAAGAEILEPESQREDALFADVFWSDPWDWKPLALAVCIYAAAFAVQGRSLAAASALLAVSAFLLVWCCRSAAAAAATATRPVQPGRLAAATVLAILLVATVLAPRVAGLSAGETRGSASGAAKASPAAAASEAPAARGSAWSVVELWPVPPKRHIVPAILPDTPQPSPGLARPLVIRFHGPYWYFEARHGQLGLQPHVAHGSPTAVDIHTNDGLPLVMEVHQRLSPSIPLANCREIEVSILDADRRPGGVSLGVVLTNSAAPGAPSIYLGSDPAASGSGEASPLPASGSEETLAFSVPIQAKIRHFNEITVLFFPDAERLTLGSKIAIEQFQLFPR